MNYFQPAVKLKEKVRIGSRIVRRYTDAETALDRVLRCDTIPEETKAALRAKRATLDPFFLAATIDRKLDEIRLLVSNNTSTTTRRRYKPPSIPAPDLYVPPPPPSP